jgi:hypothetical protein
MPFLAIHRSTRFIALTTTLLLLRLPAHGAPALDVRATTNAPVIDGKLDDPAWRDAATISELRQVVPLENAPATERTEVRVTFDSDHLYVAFRCFDHEPEKVVAKEMQHDRDTGSDDIVRVAIDTFHRQSDGYYFALTAAGSKQEGLIQNKDSVVPDWDAIWDGRAARDAEGWTAEFAIPLKSVAFDPAGAVWGFDVERIIRRKQERDRWSGLSRVKGIGSLPDLGELRGISGLRQGHGIEFRPFASFAYVPLRDVGDDRTYKLKPGMDLSWHVTPSLAATLTLNTDFAETDVDARDVNLSRFSLFFPEKRDFFLQDAALFSFGNIDYSPYPYFSRRIGLSADGTPVDILAGVKIAGRLGPMTVGLLDTQVDANGDVDSKNLLVARMAVQLSPQTSVGMLVTNGEPRANGNNTLGGLDYNYVTTHIAQNKTLHLHAWAVGTDSDLAGGRDHAEAIQFNLPNEPFSLYAYAGRYGEKYDPALGFAPRTGIYEFIFNPQYTWRPEHTWYRSASLGLQAYYVTNLHGRIDSEDHNLPSLEVDSAAGDYIFVQVRHSRDRLLDGFEIHPGVVIPTGDYQWERYHAEIGTARARPVNIGFFVQDQGFYTGRRRNYWTQVEWRASRFFYTSVTWQLRQIRLPQGNFDVRIGAVKMNVTLSPDLSLNTIAQYDNQSKQLGLNARLKWIVRPGNELFLVWNENYDADQDHVHPIAAKIATKAAWTFRW